MMKRMIDELRRLNQELPPAPWEACGGGGGSEDTLQDANGNNFAYDMWEGVPSLLAALRNALPQIIARLDRLSWKLNAAAHSLEEVARCADCERSDQCPGYQLGGTCSTGHWKWHETLAGDSSVAETANLSFGENDVINIERSDAFTAKAHELSGFITALPLTREENNQLVSLMVEQVGLAEHGAFMQGATIARDFMNYLKEHPEV